MAKTLSKDTVGKYVAAVKSHGFGTELWARMYQNSKPVKPVIAVLKKLRDLNISVDGSARGVSKEDAPEIDGLISNLEKEVAKAGKTDEHIQKVCKAFAGSVTKLKKVIKNQVSEYEKYMKSKKKADNLASQLKELHEDILKRVKQNQRPELLIWKAIKSDKKEDVEAAYKIIDKLFASVSRNESELKQVATLVKGIKWAEFEVLCDGVYNKSLYKKLIDESKPEYDSDRLYDLQEQYSDKIQRGGPFKV